MGDQLILLLNIGTCSDELNGYMTSNSIERKMMESGFL